MEYSKEDLMEAKRQILGVGENMGTEESKKIWEKNAQFWDDAMGDESNEFHREVVRPKVTELLSPDPSDYILDIACGNGNYSSFITLTEKYMTPHSYYDIAIEGQPEEQIYYHRSIQDIFNLCFRAGFVIDGFYEECFKNNKEIPMVMIVRLKKVKRDSLK